MPIISQDHLKGNYGEAHVAARLSSECLVRPVAAGTDIGLDLYCETVEDGKPFLHFWVQVKTGAQCKVAQDRKTASCSFKVDHLAYWNRQPVPVFAALVPCDWPVRKEPDVYVVDITSQLLSGVPANTGSITMTSDYVWRAGNCEEVENFLTRVVPTTAARLQCRHGVLVQMPTLHPEYVKLFPQVEVSLFQDEIANQIRRTAAFSIMCLYGHGNMGARTADFRHLLVSVVEQYGDDAHWENFISRALSYHADGSFDRAVQYYSKAIKCIQDDVNVSSQASWKKNVQASEDLRERAAGKEALFVG